MEKETLEKIIYYSAVVLVSIPLSIVFICTGDRDVLYTMLSLITIVFGIRLIVNDIPHWIKSLKTKPPNDDRLPELKKLSTVIEEYTPIVNRAIQALDSALKTNVEKESSKAEDDWLKKNIKTEELPEDINEKIGFLCRKEE